MIFAVTALVIDITAGRLEGIVLKDRRSTYRDGTRLGWWKVKDPLDRARGVAVRSAA